MIAIPNFSPKDGLYQIDKGRIHKYKAKGGTVRVYDLIEIDLVMCGECKWGNKDNEGTLWCEHAIGGIMKPTDFCSYGERRADDQRASKTESRPTRKTL